MADFDPFQNGATAVQEPKGQGEFDPFASGATASQSPVDTANRWYDLFAGLDKAALAMNPTEKAAFSSLDLMGDANAKETKAQAINLSYLQTRLPAIPPDLMQQHWPEVKQAFAEKELGWQGGEISDSTLYGLLSDQHGKNLKEHWATASPWDRFKMMFGSRGYGPTQVEEAVPMIGSEAAGTKGGAFTVPKMEGTGALAGVINAVNRVASSLTTPENAGIMAGTGGAGAMADLVQTARALALARATQAATLGTFTVIGAKDSVKAVQEAKLTLENPNATAADKADALATAALSSGMTLAAGKGTFDFSVAGVKAITATPKSPADVKAVNVVAEAMREQAAVAKYPAEADALKTAAGELDRIAQAAANASEAAPEATGKQGGIEATPTAPDPVKAAESAKESSLVGISNEAVDAELAKMGLPEATHGEKLAFEQAAQDAAAKMESDPLAGQKLVAELEANPRPVTGKENALLLHEMNRLRLERDAAQNEYLSAVESGNQLAIDRANQRVQRAIDDFGRAAEVDTRVGTENAQGLALRQMMMREDYSLASMEHQMVTASGGKVTPEILDNVRQMNERIQETQKALDEARQARAKAGLKRSTKTLEERMAAGDLEPKPKSEPIIDEELLRLKAENQRAKQEFQMALYEKRMAQRGPVERLTDLLVKWRRGFLLSNPVVLAKLAGAATLRGISIPVEDAVGSALGRLPVLSEVAAKAPAEGGFNAKALAQSYAEAITKGMKDAADEMRRGSTDLSVLYEELAGAKLPSSRMPQSAIDFFGHIHAALKSPVKRGAFKYYLEKRLEFAIKNGEDVTNPVTQTKVSVEAFKDAQRQIFMQDNALSKAFTVGTAYLKNTGHPVLAGLAKVLLPIVKVPTNIVGESLTYAGGSLSGPVRLAVAMSKGLENLKPEQADLIMREFKKGSIGAGLMLLGYFNSANAGGFYEQGEKRKSGDIKAGEVKIGDMTIPKSLLHHPGMEALQVGATVARVAHEGKNDTADGTTAAALGLIEGVPFLRESVELAKFFDPKDRTRAEGELVKSLVVPGVVQWLAEQADRENGDKIKRKVKTVGESVQSGIPGLRQNLPAKGQSAYAN